MITPADTDRRVTLSPPQSASEYAWRSPLCCHWNKHSARGYNTRHLPILSIRSRSDTGGFAIAQHRCIAANLRSCRSCDKKLMRGTSALYFVTVTTFECLTVVRVVTFVICHLHSVLVARIIPIVFGLSPSLFTLVLALAPITSCIVLLSRCIESLRDSLVPVPDPSNITLTCLWSASIVMSS